MTYKEALSLINEPKYIMIDGERVEIYEINQQFPLRQRLFLETVDETVKMIWDIKQSSKRTIKMSLHLQENNGNIGLIRIDYNGGAHHNPEVATEDLPLIFKPYIGHVFSIQETHVHYHVQGYRPLVWALPVDKTEFKVKTLEPDGITTTPEAIKEFSDVINIQTKLIINKMVL